MPSWLSNLVGTDLAGPASVLLAAAIVIGLLVLVIWVAKKTLGGSIGIRGKGRGPRLAVMDVAAVDQKRKLVLVRRDEVEHLILIGGQNDLVVEASILRVPAAARARAEQSARLEPSTIEGQGRSAAPGPRDIRSEPNLAGRTQDGRTASPLTRPVPRPVTQAVRPAAGDGTAEPLVEALPASPMATPSRVAAVSTTATIQAPETILNPAATVSPADPITLVGPAEQPRGPQKAPDVIAPVEPPLRGPASFGPPPLPPVMPPRPFQASLTSQRQAPTPPSPPRQVPTPPVALPPIALAQDVVSQAPADMDTAPPELRDPAGANAASPASGPTAQTRIDLRRFPPPSFAPVLGQARSMATPTLPPKVAAVESRSIQEIEAAPDGIEEDAPLIQMIDRKSAAAQPALPAIEIVEAEAATDSDNADIESFAPITNKAPLEEPVPAAEPVRPEQKPFPWRPASLSTKSADPLDEGPPNSAQAQSGAISAISTQLDLTPSPNPGGLSRNRSSPILPPPPRQMRTSMLEEAGSQTPGDEATPSGSSTIFDGRAETDTPADRTKALVDEDRNGRRPLSVRSFATAIQARKVAETKSEQKPAPQPFVRAVEPVWPPVPEALVQRQPEPEAVKASGIEDLLSAELDSSLRSTDWGDVDKKPADDDLDQPKPATTSTSAEPAEASPIEPKASPRPLTLEEEMERLLGDFDFEFSDRKTR